MLGSGGSVRMFVELSSSSANPGVQLLSRGLGSVLQLLDLKTYRNP